MIPQPALGELLIELRKKKGWTQEELVAQCHVSVRTIQRIESGEVTPRTSTIKLLLAALDFEASEWNKEGQMEENNRSIKLLKQMFVANLSQDEIKKPLNIAWIAGIIYLVLSVIETITEIAIFDQVSPSEQKSYIAIKLLVAGSYVFFVRGFLSLAELFENTLLKTATYANIIMVTLMYTGYIVLILLFPQDDWVWVIYEVGFSVIIGCLGVVFAIGLIRLQDGMGKMAYVAGVFEMVMGICFASVIFSPLGLIVAAPAIVLEILLLSRANELAIKGKI